MMTDRRVLLLIVVAAAFAPSVLRAQRSCNSLLKHGSPTVSITLTTEIETGTFTPSEDPHQGVLWPRCTLFLLGRLLRRRTRGPAAGLFDIPTSSTALLPGIRPTSAAMRGRSRFYSARDSRSLDAAPAKRIPFHLFENCRGLRQWKDTRQPQYESGAERLWAIVVIVDGGQTSVTVFRDTP